MQEILEKIKNFEFPEEFDFMIAIGRGGIIPAAILNQKLNLEMGTLWLRFRDEKNNAMGEHPKLVKEFELDAKDKRILIVDDVSRTGASLNYVKELLKDAKSVRTFVINGKADFYLYDEECFKFPWKL